MRVAGYVRVSSAEQALAGYSLPDQEREIRLYAAGRGWHDVTIFVEPGDSAFTDEVTDRPVFARLLAEVEQGQWQAVIVKKLDRFARSAIVSFTQLKTILDHGCTLIDLSMMVDYGTTAGRMIFGFLSVIAENESRNISDRTRAGIAQKRREGKHVGAIPWGARRTPAGQLAIDEAHATTLERILRLVATASYGRVVAALNADGIPSPRGTLWRPAVIHKLIRDGRWLLEQPEPWPALWVAACTRVRPPATNWSANRSMLTGLLRCACGGTIVYTGKRHNKDGTVRFQMQCRHYTTARPASYGCAIRKRGARYYEGLASAWVGTLPDLGGVRPRETGDALAQAADIAERRVMAGALLDGRSIDLAEYRRRIAALDAEEATLRRPRVAHEELARQVTVARYVFPGATPSEQNAVLRQLLRRIVVHGDTVTFEPTEDLGVLLDLAEFDRFTLPAG